MGNHISVHDSVFFYNLQSIWKDIVANFSTLAKKFSSADSKNKKFVGKTFYVWQGLVTRLSTGAVESGLSLPSSISSKIDSPRFEPRLLLSTLVMVYHFQKIFSQDPPIKFKAGSDHKSVLMALFLDHIVIAVLQLKNCFELCEGEHWNPVLWRIGLNVHVAFCYLERVLDEYKDQFPDFDIASGKGIQSESSKRDRNPALDEENARAYVPSRGLLTNLSAESQHRSKERITPITELSGAVSDYFKSKAGFQSGSIPFHLVDLVKSINSWKSDSSGLVQKWYGGFKVLPSDQIQDLSNEVLINCCLYISVMISAAELLEPKQQVVYTLSSEKPKNGEWAAWNRKYDSASLQLEMMKPLFADDSWPVAKVEPEEELAQNLNGINVNQLETFADRMMAWEKAKATIP